MEGELVIGLVVPLLFYCYHCHNFYTVTDILTTTTVRNTVRTIAVRSTTSTPSFPVRRQRVLKAALFAFPISVNHEVFLDTVCWLALMP